MCSLVEIFIYFESLLDALSIDFVNSGQIRVVLFTLDQLFSSLDLGSPPIVSTLATTNVCCGFIIFFCSLHAVLPISHCGTDELYQTHMYCILYALCVNTTRKVEQKEKCFCATWKCLASKLLMNSIKRKWKANMRKMKESHFYVMNKRTIPYLFKSIR